MKTNVLYCGATATVILIRRQADEAYPEPVEGKLAGPEGDTHD